MIYSTCSILKEENEENINKILKNKNIEIVPIDEELYKDIPQLPTSIKGTVCIMPSKLYEGFYVAKLRKK
jgi:16S rRNA C967 or C1407 C5-methylase (RsmB/RsmF family)